jgi:hypothetical protein
LGVFRRSPYIGANAADFQKCSARAGRLECMKALLLLNGGGALALLTFFGNRGKMLTADSADAIGHALSGFGVGTVGSVLMFAFAYFTQLRYGNVGFKNPALAFT